MLGLSHNRANGSYGFSIHKRANACFFSINGPTRLQPPVGILAIVFIPVARVTFIILPVEKDDGAIAVQFFVLDFLVKPILQSGEKAPCLQYDLCIMPRLPWFWLALVHIGAAQTGRDHSQSKVDGKPNVLYLVCLPPWKPYAESSSMLLRLDWAEDRLLFTAVSRFRSAMTCGQTGARTV